MVAHKSLEVREEADVLTQIMEALVVLLMVEMVEKNRGEVMGVLEAQMVVVMEVIV